MQVVELPRKKGGSQYASHAFQAKLKEFARCPKMKKATDFSVAF
jgi:hypothetical protein